MFEPKTETERTVLAFFQALGTSDFDGARALMTPDMSWAVMGTGVPGAGTHVGPDAIFAVIGPIRALFAPGSPRMTLRCVTSNEDRVVMETHGGGEFADGRPYDNNYAMSVDVKDGKVCALREYMDSYYVNQLKLPGGA